jgi:mRNA degradation ribonuclease J1/J2
MLNIRCVKVGLLGTNCYLVSNNDETIVIDPGASFSKIDSMLGNK